MTREQAKERVAKLREQINDYRYQYHVHDKSIMSEAAADSLKHELQQLEREHPDLITSDSPTQRVAGQPSPKFASVAHQMPMLSLNDVFSQEETEAWITRIKKLEPDFREEFYAELKMDGLAATLIYENGVLVRGLTRGDGRVGEDVTPNLRTIEQIPLRLRHDSAVPDEVYKGRLEIRGEVLMYKKTFEALNQAREKAGLALFANPRNTAAGTIRQLDPRLVAARPLCFHVYAIATPLSGVTTHAAEHALAAKLGFKVEPHSQLVRGIEGIMEFARKWEEKRKELPYLTDGLVATVNDQDAYRRLGVVGKAPRGAIAYKFPAEQATTKIKNIMVSMGRTGAATPFAVMEPTVVAGSTVQMATLHNESEIARKDIRIGDTVIIQKAGDVIPEVVAPLPKLRTGKEKKFVMPKDCPVCGKALFKKPEEAVWRCVNFDCPALGRGRIIHFASKAAFDIEGLGEKIVDVLLDTGLIKDAADLFTLKESDLLALERFAEISAGNLVNSIQSRKKVPFDRFIYALGIRHVGAQTAADLATHFVRPENFCSVTVEKLEAVPGIGNVVAKSVYDWLQSERHQRFLDKLFTNGVQPQPIEKVEGPLNGKNFVITGTLAAFSREAGGERIEALGGKLQNSLTKETDYLVVGEDPGANKIAQAEKYGTVQINEKQLLKILEK
ncbi:MAG TPA: NAD-dependent DNA ligase LigA [Candidatus Dormibacteraeota bacterium]|nr:NAD-dependent DNA ligase LigA [Candidatus Dormibacteraeota bacterium]